MKDFFNIRLLDNSLADLGMALFFILLALAFKNFAGKRVVHLVLTFFGSGNISRQENELLKLVLGPFGKLIFVWVLYVACGSLEYPAMLQFRIFKLPAEALLDRLMTGIIILLFFRTLLKVTDFVASIMERKTAETEDYSDDQLVIFFREFLKVLLIIICVLLVIRFVFNQDVTKLLAGLSIVGAAIALAAKESIENLIASFIIFFDKPFTVGDLLKVQQVQGTVEKIGLRSTRIRSVDKTYVTIPNKQMVDSIVDNLSQRQLRRGDLSLFLDLKTSGSAIEELLQALESGIDFPELVEKTILLQDIRIDAYVVYIEYYTTLGSIADFNRFKRKLNLFVIALTEAKGISIAGKNRIPGLNSF